ncbi:MAG: hypothetical protein SFU98_19280 [Leptospiraceae bacterium]|nr:hypothetical protein [Leptospiraceae bacterium]
MKFYFIVLVLFAYCSSPPVKKPEEKVFIPEQKITKSIKRYFTLGGFKLSQKLKLAETEFGTPYKVHKFEDGFIGYAYKRDGYFIIFESNNRQTDRIWSIQIQGNSNPEGFGLDTISLGDSITKVYEAFGNPDNSRDAKDLINPEMDLKGTKILDYYKNSNFSLEIKDGIVTSIKILLNGFAEIKKPDLNQYFDKFSDKDLYKIVDSLGLELDIIHNGKKIVFTKSFLYHLKNDSIMNEVLTSDTKGIAGLKEVNVKASMTKMYSENLEGILVRFERNNKDIEIVFIKSFDGVVIREINIKQVTL